MARRARRNCERTDENLDLDRGGGSRLCFPLVARLSQTAGDLRRADPGRVEKMHLAKLGRIKRLDRDRDDFNSHPGIVHGGGGPDFCPNLFQNPVAIMRLQWFVIHTLSGQEQKVKESIEKRVKT